MAIKNIKLSNGQTYSIDADVVVDPSMSDTSANAVENKVIKAYVDTGLEGKQDKTNSSLETTAKTVVGAINELKEGVDSTNAIDLTDYIGVIENISEKDFFKGKSISKTIEGNAFYNVITSYLTNSKPIEIRVQLSGMGIICIPIMCFSQETNSISLEGILNIDGIALETGMCNFFLVCSITATVDSTSITLNFANKPFWLLEYVEYFKAAVTEGEAALPDNSLWTLLSSHDYDSQFILPGLSIPFVSGQNIDSVYYNLVLAATSPGHFSLIHSPVIMSTEDRDYLWTWSFDVYENRIVFNQTKILAANNDLSNVIDLSPYRTLQNAAFPSSGTLSSEGVALVQNNWDKNVLFRWDYYTFSFYLVPSMKWSQEGQTAYVLFATTITTIEQQDYCMGVWLMINSGKDTDNYMCQSTRAWLDLKQDKTDNLLNTTNKTVVGAINELNTNKQNITDNTLETTSKEIVGAINEIDAGYGNKIDVSIDSSSYVMTVTLKNRQGSPLSSSQIDLPLESVVVNGAYNSETKEVELTLQNGSKISFSVADLVNGIQSEITEQNKLSADLVDDTSTTNKFVTQDILNQISQNTADRHTHANKAILDATTASYTTAEQEKLAGLENYTLPTATSTTLGGVKVGSGLEITLDGILSASSQAQTINLTDYITDGSLNIDFFTTIIQKISAEGSAKYSGTLSNATDLFNKVNTYNSNSLGFNIALTLTDVKIIFTDVMYGISVDSISIVGTCLISMDGSTFVFSLQISGSNTAMEYSLSVINENIIYLTKYATEFNQAYTNHNTVSLPDNSLSELLSSHYYSLFVVPIYTPPATLLLRVAGTHNDSVVLSEVQLVENEGKITSANLNSFLVSSSSVSYGSKSLQFTTSDELTTTSKEIVGAINELKTTTDNLSSSKQNINDNTLTTTDKTVVGAINELKTSKYTKPTEGIGLDDLSSSVQASLSKADTAIQQVKTINGLSIVGEGNLVIGDSGTSLPALPEDAATKTYVLKAVNGVFQWVEEPLTLTEA